MTRYSTWTAALGFLAFASAHYGPANAGGASLINGFRRYNSACNHCHGPDGVGSTFAPSLIGQTIDIERFRQVVFDGKAGAGSVMKGFGGDPNIAPYVDDIYAYLEARAKGELGRGRPEQ